MTFALALCWASPAGALGWTVSEFFQGYAEGGGADSFAAGRAMGILEMSFLYCAPDGSKLDDNLYTLFVQLMREEKDPLHTPVGARALAAVALKYGIHPRCALGASQ
jgi:hypothetical protein